MSRYADSRDGTHCPECIGCAEGDCFPDDHRPCMDHYLIGLAGAKGY